MKITKDVQAQARRLLRLCRGTDGLLDEERVRCVATAVLERRPRNGLALLTSFTELVRLDREAHTATITSAVPLSEDEQQRIRTKLDARHAGLHYVWQNDPALIGGLSVRVGDSVTDASLRSRIERLSRI